MACSALDDLLRYLRGPAAPHHRLGLQDGRACPHCDGRRVQRWGRSSGRQRFRCTTCRRTFSTFTGTALHYLKRIDQWRTYLWCMDGQLTVRLAAAVTGLNKDTTFRWRHRLLSHSRDDDRTVLRRRVAVGEFRFPRSEKGSRTLERTPRRQGVRWHHLLPRSELVTVLVARERDEAMIMDVLGCRPAWAYDYRDLLLPRFRNVTEVVGFRGPRCTLAAVARSVGIEYCPDPKSISFLPHDLRAVRHRLIAWLKPFNGVATKYLPNYLQWFRTAIAYQGRSPPPTVPADSAR